MMPKTLDNDTVYIVSSCHRAGSSMMMRCLIEAGMPAVWDFSQERLNQVGGDYKPNPNGFYALNENWRDAGVYDKYKGKLVKISHDDLKYLPTGKYHIVFMTRNVEESRQSWIKAFKTVRVIYEVYDLYVTSLLKYLNDRGDCTVQVIDYGDVISQPLIEFEKIDMPIDINIAVSFVEDDLYRVRIP
jgi:hypothetical protein